MKSRLSTRFSLVVGAAFFIAVPFAWTPVQAQDRPHIKREQIDSMFSAMRAKAPWYVDGPLLWGYFFFAPSRERLEQVATELEGKGYHVVGIEAPRGKLRLHVERVERHTPASLDARNEEFYALAERYGVSYDGMDVGPAQVQGGK
jgi:hypothetical protein